jgi:pimeloyl-ACP methyl ester carboxylesterase
MARSIAAQALLPRFRRAARTPVDARVAIPEPPVALPPGRIVHVPGRGEFFVRDTGVGAAGTGAADAAPGPRSGGPGAADPRAEDAGRAGTVLLLHGWMFSSDLNWFTTYADLQAAGYRVIALDHRGHGRGLRSPEPFRLQDCADDAAAVLRELDAAPALVVGYSLGGAVAQLLARDHPDVTAGIVLCATANEWSDPKLRLLWSAMAGLRLVLGLSPEGIWRRVMVLMGEEGGTGTDWQAAELGRGSAVALAEAGRELGRFDSRPWNGALTAPSAVVVTRDDTSVPPAKQRALAASLGAPYLEAPGTHGAVTMLPETFNPVLLEALATVSTARPAAVPAG